jgi:cell division control protein 45
MERLQLISAEQYLLYYHLFEDEVKRLNPPPLQDSKTTEPFIKASSELQFMLVRHWSLENAMLHSPYLASRLRLFSDTGRRKLQQLLAQIGIPLEQARQCYTYMDVDLKRLLGEKLDRVKDAWGLDNMRVKGFVRASGYRSLFSASDYAFIISAFLAGGHTDGGGGGDGQGKDDDDDDGWLHNFYAAYDSLDNIDAMLAGLDVAMEMERAILRTGSALIEKHAIKNLRSFRLAVLRDGPDLPVFENPVALGKLAAWVDLAIKEEEKQLSKKKHLPFVIASLNTSADLFLVFGKHSDGGNQNLLRNRFGQAFHEVASENRARVRIDSFDTSVVEVRKADLASFLEGLGLRLMSA